MGLIRLLGSDCVDRFWQSVGPRIVPENHCRLSAGLGEDGFHFLKSSGFLLSYE